MNYKKEIRVHPKLGKCNYCGKFRYWLQPNGNLIDTCEEHDDKCELNIPNV